MVEDKATRTGFLNILLKWIASKNGHPDRTSSSCRTLSLRSYLVLLVAGTLLPVVLFAVAVVYKLSSQEQAATERRILLATRNLAAIVERELSGTIRTLQVLATSERIEQGNLKNFHREARRVVQTQPSWIAVILLSPEGQQVVNTTRPFGTPLPQAREPASLRRVVETHQPTVGNISPSIFKPIRLGFPVRIPVMRNGKLQYILTAVINQKAIANVVSDQTSIDGEWTRTVVDGKGVVVVRTRDPERFVGQRGTPSFLKRISEANEGIYRDTTLEGRKVYVAFSQVDDTPWTVAITVPVDVIQGPARQAMWLVIGSGLALLLVSGIGSFILSRYISLSITSAALAAEALAKGESPQIKPLLIEEVVFLGQSLEFAANLLSQREQERNENLQRAEAAREEAEAANRMKDEFLAVLSHELRTPLNPILGWSKLLRGGRLDAAKTAFALETIERNAKLQTQLIEDLLDVARIMQGKLSLKTVPVNLVFTINSAIETVRLAAEAKSIDLRFTTLDLGLNNGDSQNPQFLVLGDSARLQQVIWNLLINAVKFTPEGGRVEVRLLRVASQAQIQVIDTGKGIDPNFLPFVFEYFRQEDSKTTRKFGGLGLGLAIVRHLVELHGGTVQADSPGEEQGATFIVSLPLLRDEGIKNTDESSDSSSLTLQSAPLKGLRVLVVDDDLDMRNFLIFTLEQNHAIVTAVGSAREALQALEEKTFALLISDIGMPEMDGYTLMQQIRSRYSQQDRQVRAVGKAMPKAIALTAYAGEHNQQQALQVGFQLHLAKPVEPQALVRAIVDLVNSCQEKP
ncbi:response regulator [Phormidium sp. LEGE 05292]|uniref:hybrid sensor histidine kinase/response regulator n=1 Tax=[Phormidium] sp. LEGE 05292 TaxID=767427 RepID=UPI00187F9B1F|nr:hybrid sensor histidine kinase/response regulator [Phormidium sp. LEGE 05292]MBE9225008.1 response regulator [Phormidium sp. LEGE 05292]